VCCEYCVLYDSTPTRLEFVSEPQHTLSIPADICTDASTEPLRQKRFDNVPRLEVAHYVKRVVEERALGEWLHDESPKPLVIQGMGGSGKTQLALQCCRLARDIRFKATFWINASSPSTVLDGYRTILNILSLRNTVRSDTLAMEAAQAIFGDWTEPWLIVFDGYDDPSAFSDESIKVYFPRAPRGYVLITSRNRDTSRLGITLEPSAMTEQEGLELLLRSADVAQEQLQEARQLAEALGYLPLALDQAGAYIRSRGIWPSRYLELFNKHQKQLLESIPAEWEYRKNELPQSVQTTLELSLARLKGSPKEVKQKVHFLTLAAFLNTDCISERYFKSYVRNASPPWTDFLKTGNTWDSDCFGDLLAELQQYFLLQTKHDGANEHQFSMHRLVSTWMRLRSSIDPFEYVKEVTLILASHLSNADLDILPQEEKQETLSHVDTWININETVLQDSFRTVLDLSTQATYRIAVFCKSQGQLGRAEKLLLRTLEYCESSKKPDLREKVFVMSELGAALLYQAKFSQSEQIFEQALEECRKVLGSEHHVTLFTMDNLASTYRKQRKLKAAEKLEMEVIMIKKRLLSVEHPDTLTSMCNLALTFYDQGRLKEAEELLTQVVEMRAIVLGKEHPATLSSMYSLALVFSDQERHKEAEELLTQVVEMRVRVLGTEHPATLISKDKLASMYRN
jgi:tetratricopeptide (TPR) repeat protein